jgi:cobalt-zinc-cadmium efflux system protein
MTHDHSSEVPKGGPRLGLSIALTLAFVAVEVLAGFSAHSLALLSDAGHNLSDALALIISWFALRMSRWPADAKQTYGYRRAGILAALANSVSLVVIALYIFWEAAKRLRSPEPVASVPMIAVALVAVVLNGVISFWLRTHAKNDLNVRSAYLHMLGDAVSALGVVAAGIVVALTGATIADPIVSLLIGLLILWSSWEVLAESVNVLMEGVPKGLDLGEVERAIRGGPDVQAVHHLHVWTIASGLVACSCHIVVTDRSARGGEQVLLAVAAMLKERFGIQHTTIQVEVEGCEPGRADCDLQTSSHPEAEHGH